jgi:hypothetical protein
MSSSEPAAAGTDRDPLYLAILDAITDMPPEEYALCGRTAEVAANAAHEFLGVDGRIELDRDRIESDRYVVLLACGHWVHTRRPEDSSWWCPVIEPESQNHGDQPAALTDDGKPAVLASWDIWADQAGGTSA